MTETPPPEPPAATDQGKILAVVSYASMFVGLPLFVIPMITRDDPFALHHAKLAGVAYIGFLLTFFVVMAISMVTCGFGAILIFLCFFWWVPAVFGVIDALSSKTSPMPVLSDVSASLFGGIQPKLGEP